MDIFNMSFNGFHSQSNVSLPLSCLLPNRASGGIHTNLAHASTQIIAQAIPLQAFPSIPVFTDPISHAEVLPVSMHGTSSAIVSQPMTSHQLNMDINVPDNLPLATKCNENDLSAQPSSSLMMDKVTGASDQNQTPSTPRVKDYKCAITAMSHDGEKYLDIDHRFTKKYETKVALEWNLVDPKGIVQRVHYHVSHRRSMLTYGWPEVREFYGLRGMFWISLKLVENSNFDLFIFDSHNREINYEPAPQPDPSELEFILPSPNYYKCQFFSRLTEHQARGIQMTIPRNVLGYVRLCRLDVWSLKGPGGSVTKCRIIAPSDRKYGKIGKGWKEFCKENELNGGDGVTLKFTKPDVGIVNVVIHRAGNY